MMVEDYQRLQTYLRRAIIDNIHRLLLHRVFISRDALVEGDLTVDSLANREDAAVFVDGEPGKVAMLGAGQQHSRRLDGGFSAGSGAHRDPWRVPIRGAVDTDVNQNTPYGALMSAADKAGDALRQCPDDGRNRFQGPLHQGPPAVQGVPRSGYRCQDSRGVG